MPTMECGNCGKDYEREPLEDSYINFCGPCARHYLYLINEAMLEVADLDKPLTEHKRTHI